MKSRLTILELFRDLWHIFITESIHDFGFFGTIVLAIANTLIFGIFALFILPRFLTLWAYGLMGALLIGALSLLVPKLKSTR